MKCPYCNIEIDENVDVCPNCGRRISKRHSTLGKISLTCTILSIVCIGSSLIIPFLLKSSTISMIIILIFLLAFMYLLFAIIAIVLGAISYLGKTKDWYGLAGAIIGVIIIFATPLILGAATYIIFISPFESSFDQMTSLPFILCESENNTLTLLAASNASWSDISLETDNDATQLSFNGGEFHTVGIVPVPAEELGATGYVNAGDYFNVRSDSEQVTITFIYDPTGSTLGSYTVSNLQS